MPYCGIVTTTMITIENAIEVIKFWFPNNKFNDFWFDKSIDEVIRNRFNDLHNQIILKMQKAEVCMDLDLQLSQLSNIKLLALVIIIDQFTRNLYRDDNLRHIIKQYDHYAIKIVDYIMDNKIDVEYPINQRIFLLLPYRHQHNVKLLYYVLDKITKYSESQFDSNERKLLERFIIATLKNFTEFTEHNLQYCDNNQSQSPNNINNLNFNDFNIVGKYIPKGTLDPMCDDYVYDTKTFDSNMKLVQSIIKFIKQNNIKRIGISISGGVDSMVLSYILKNLEMNNIIEKVVGIHMQYGNRDDSKDEADLIYDWCKSCMIPLYIKNIDYMRRDTTDRNFYEEETRKLRFNIYKYAIEHHNLDGFTLGHHSDDLAENVFMNIMKGRDITDLCVMESISIIDGVNIMRPMLTHPKMDIFDYAKQYLIPFTKDTTPDWSCRGVIRRQLYPIMENQFGDFTKHLRTLGQQSIELNNTLEKKINDLYSKLVINKNIGIKLMIDVINELKNSTNTFITKFLIKMFHSMNINMTKLQGVQKFIEWLNNPQHLFRFTNNTFAFGHNGCVYIFRDNIEWQYTISDTSNDDKIRKQFTYDDVLTGQLVYTERYNDMNPLKQINRTINKIDKNDYTRKLFTQIPFVSVPFFTSGKWTIINDMNDYKTAIVTLFIA